MISVGIVDDDAMVRTGLRFILAEDADITVAWQAADGAEALARLDETDADVLLLDIRMTGMDGLATLEALNARGGRPKVIVLTTFNTDDYVVRALQRGAEGFLLKDAAPERLVEAIRRVHAGEPALSPEVTHTLISVATDAAPAADPAAARAFAALTEREKQVAVLMADGLTNAQIGSRLGVSMASVKAHLSTIFTKLGVDNRVSAAMAVRDAGAQR